MGVNITAFVGLILRCGGLVGAAAAVGVEPAAGVAVGRRLGCLRGPTAAVGVEQATHFAPRTGKSLPKQSGEGAGRAGCCIRGARRRHGGLSGEEEGEAQSESARGLPSKHVGSLNRAAAVRPGLAGHLPPGAFMVPGVGRINPSASPGRRVTGTQEAV